MPPRRPTSGRHRRPRNSTAPVTLTAATVAAFAVGGLNVPGAIGDSQQTPVASSSDQKANRARAAIDAANAAAMRAELEEQAQARADRMRKLRAKEARQARREAARRARVAAERARPKYVKPVLNYELSAGFGETSGLWSSVHTGQDFAAPEGTPVRSAIDGTIVFAGWDGAYGNKIVVEHADGTLTWYAHLSAFQQTSGTVKAGDVIGNIGTTGNSTGPHLHFEVRPGGGAPVPPLTWLRSHGVSV